MREVDNKPEPFMRGLIDGIYIDRYDFATLTKSDPPPNGEHGVIIQYPVSRIRLNHILKDKSGN